jgi:hypothetical protein
MGSINTGCLHSGRQLTREGRCWPCRRPEPPLHAASQTYVDSMWQR